MTIHINETISNVYTEDRQLINSITDEMYTLIPDEGKVFKNALTGKIIDGTVTIKKKEAIKNYIEINRE